LTTSFATFSGAFYIRLREVAVKSPEFDPS